MLPSIFRVCISLKSALISLCAYKLRDGVAAREGKCSATGSTGNARVQGTSQQSREHAKTHVKHRSTMNFQESAQTIMKLLHA